MGSCVAALGRLTPPREMRVWCALPGNFPYFQCTNKGCNPANGIALHLDQPTAVPTKFSMNCTITVPRPISTGKNQFNLLLFGVDQDHYPVDFAVSMYYHLTDSAMQA